MLDICWKGGYKGNKEIMVIKVKNGISERKDDRIKAIRNLEKILAEPNDYCDNCDEI